MKELSLSRNDESPEKKELPPSKKDSLHIGIMKKIDKIKNSVFI